MYFFEKKFSRAEDCAESCAEECAKSQLFFNVCCSAKPFVVRRYFSKIRGMLETLIIIKFRGQFSFIFYAVGF